MRQGYHVAKAIMESGMASTQLCQVLRLFLDEDHKNIFTDDAGWVYIYLKDTHSTYPILKKVETLIEEACNIAIKLNVSKEAFYPLGKMIDSL